MGAHEPHLPVVMSGQKNVSMAAFGREQRLSILAESGP